MHRRQFLATTALSVSAGMTGLARLCRADEVTWPNSDEDISVDVYPVTKTVRRSGEGSICVLDDGSLLYATTEFSSAADAAKAHIVARRSVDGGRTWGEKRELQENTGKLNVMSTTLRRLPKWDGAKPPVGMFYLEKNAPDDLKVMLRVSKDECRTFGEPIQVSTIPGYHVMNNDRVTVLKSGRLLAPVASSPNHIKVNHFKCFCFLSDDGGRTWRVSKNSVDYGRRGAMEPEVIELKDGTVLMIFRTQLGHIAAATSADGGETWSEAKSFGVRAPEAPATLRRIPTTGDLLLLWNDTFTEGAGHGGRRTPLNSAVSSDEGKTWKHKRVLEDDPTAGYCYMSLIFHKGRAVMSYYVKGGSRFRSLPIEWFYA